MLNFEPKTHELENMMTFCRQHRKVYVWGEGHNSQMLGEFLQRESAGKQLFTGYVVSDETKIQLRGATKPFEELADSEEMEHTGFLLACSDLYFNDILSLIFGAGYGNDSVFMLSEYNKYAIAELSKGWHTELNPEGRQPANWEAVEKNTGLEQLMWRKRIAAMARFLDERDHVVLDIGAGDMHLRNMVPEGAHYIPADYKRRAEDTYVCDLNQREFPDVQADAIVCAGILDYMEDPAWFLDEAMAHCRKLIISYKGREQFSYAQLYARDVVAYLREHGFGITGRCDDLGRDWTLLACFERMEPATLGRHQDCTGCGACVNACPTGAMTLRYAEDGFLRPVLSTDRCTNCGTCVRACPALRNVPSDNVRLPDCYAAWGTDDLRRISSSGGAFSVLSENIIARGGKVYGVQWNERFEPIYVSTELPEGLAPMRYSKYVQSNPLLSFREVQQDLLAGRPVFYVGSPCQIAGLKGYLGSLSRSPQLVTADLLCFSCGGPYPAFAAYLEQNFGLEQVADVNFRYKQAPSGWAPASYRVSLKNGSEQVSSRAEQDTFQQAFHETLARRDVCERCRYLDFPRQGDLTIGDFWGIERHDRGWNDGRGTSLIYVSTEKGQKFLREAWDRFSRIEQVPSDWPLNSGNSLRRDGRRGDLLRQQYFRFLLGRKDFNTAVAWSRGLHYDFGLVCMKNYNIGNNLTNFALWRTLQDMGKSCILLDVTAGTGASVSDKYRFFLENPYPVYARDELQLPTQRKDLSLWNERCDAFLTGSDQLFRSSFLRAMAWQCCLPWARDAKFKASYGTSFGTDIFEGTKAEKQKLRFLLRRYQKLSLREQSGVELLQGEIGLEAQQVMDPVFLCDRAHYERMAKLGRMRLPEGKFVFAYLLDATPAKEEAVKALAQARAEGVQAAVLERLLFEQQHYDGPLNALPCPCVEEWLAGIADSEAVLTDSFHGVCFCLIFRKQFFVLFDKKNWRGYARLRDILSSLSLEERLLPGTAPAEEMAVLPNIDYGNIASKLEERIESSRTWLRQRVEEAETYDGEVTEYDFLLDILEEMRQKDATKTSSGK